MELNLMNITLLLVLLQIQGLSAFKRHHEVELFNDNDDDDDDRNSKRCIYYRYDHETRQTDTMSCQFGCCGDLDDQKCCDDPEKDKDDNWGNARLVHGLLIFAGVMMVIAISCCGFGIYKHKNAKLRKTSPQKYQTTVSIARPAPDAIFYTRRSGNRLEPAKSDKTDLPGDRSQSERTRPPSVHTPPPRYTENAEPDPECPPYDMRSPPPPYSQVPPTATRFQGID